MIERDETEWLAWRREGITATDVADAAAGTYGGMYGVVSRKLGLVPPPEQNDAMRRGHRWQFKIADAVHALVGLWVVGEEHQVECPHRPEWRATVDGYLSRSEVTSERADLWGVLEVKTTGVNVRPDRGRWLSQVQWQLLCTGLDRGMVAHAVIDDSDDTVVSLRFTEVQADRMHQELLEELAVEMLHHVRAGTLPDPDDGSALEVVKSVWSDVDDTVDVADLSDLSDELQRLADLGAAIKHAQAEKDAIEAVVRHRIGAGTHGAADHFKVTVSRPAMVLPAAVERQLADEHPEYTKRVLDRDLIKKEAPELYEAHRQPTGARRLTVKHLEGNNNNE
jgi:predicted phage-related endonuclease